MVHPFASEHDLNRVLVLERGGRIYSEREGIKRFGANVGIYGVRKQGFRKRHVTELGTRKLLTSAQATVLLQDTLMLAEPVRISKT